KIVRRFGTGSYPLGIRANLSWETSSSTLAGGETLLLYSDGLYEARDASDAPFGEERIERTVRLLAGSRPQELVSDLSRQLNSFLGSRLPEDDVSIAAVKKK
ncbi:MAG TPA: SpoIIE family protein phosphatase, partial [Thermoanaerobaculia bacterium]